MKYSKSNKASLIVTIVLIVLLSFGGLGVLYTLTRGGNPSDSVKILVDGQAVDNEIIVNDIKPTVVEIVTDLDFKVNITINKKIAKTFGYTIDKKMYSLLELDNKDLSGLFNIDVDGNRVSISSIFELKNFLSNVHNVQIDKIKFLSEYDVTKSYFNFNIIIGSKMITKQIKGKITVKEITLDNDSIIIRGNK